MATETKNYLTAVIFRIDFTDPVKVLPKTIERVKTEIQDRLNEFHKGELETIAVEMGPEEQKTIRKKSDFFDFTNNEKSERLRISQNNISFEVKEYKNYEYFRILIGDVLTEFNLKGNIKRLGLRYINELNIKEGSPFDWEGWVNATLIKSLEFYNTERLARSMGVMNYIFDDFKLIFKYEMYNSEFPNPISKKEFVLDFECVTKEPCEIDDPLDLLDKMHDFINEIFKESIGTEFERQRGKDLL